MKRLVWLTFASLLFAASACTTYTCPTYAQYDAADEIETVEAEEPKF